MIEAYVIGVSLELDDTITGQLGGVYEQTQHIAGSVDTINEAMAKTSEVVGGLAASVGSLTASLAEAVAAARDLKDAAAGTSFGGGYAGHAAGNSGSGGPPPGAPPDTATSTAPIDGSSAAGDGGANFHRSSDAPNSTSDGGGRPPPPPPPDEPFTPTGGPVPMYPAGKPKSGGAGGLSMKLGLSDLFFANAVLDAGGHIVDQAFSSFADPDQQTTQMELTDKRFTKADGDKAIAAAGQIVNQNHGMSFIGALTLILQGYIQTHDIDASIAMAGPLAADALRLHNSGRDNDVDDIWKLQKSAEVSHTLNSKNKDGSIDIKPFMDWIGNATQVLQDDQNVNPNDIWLATQQNDLGAMSVSPKGQAEQDIVAGLLGGYKSGTGSAQLEREMIGGKMSTGTAETLEKLGLVDPTGAIKTGQYYTMKPGALKDEDLFASNPVEWFQKDFQPAVDRMSPNDRDAMFHDIIAGTGTASGAREAVVDVMQKAVIQRMLYWAYRDEPNAAQSKKILDANPNNAAGFASAEFHVLENAYLNGSAAPITGFLNWAGNEENKLANNLPGTLWDNSVNQFKSFAGTALKGAGESIGALNPLAGTPGIPMPSPIADIKDFFTKLLTKAFDDLVNAIESQGGNPSSAIYVKQVPTGPTLPQASRPTNRNTTLSPALPGRVTKTP